MGMSDGQFSAYASSLVVQVREALKQLEENDNEGAKEKLMILLALLEKAEKL